MINENLIKASIAAKQLGKLPLGPGRKGFYAGSAVLSKQTFGAENHPPTAADMDRLRKAVVEALRGQTYKSRAVEILFTVVHDGSRVDPVQRLEVESLLTVLRLLRKTPALEDLFQRIWWGLQADPSPTLRGPVTRLQQIFRHWQWDWRTPHELVLPGDRPLNLFHDPVSWIKEEARYAACRAQWRHDDGLPVLSGCVFDGG